MKTHPKKLQKRAIWIITNSINVHEKLSYKLVLDNLLNHDILYGMRKTYWKPLVAHRAPANWRAYRKVLCSRYTDLKP